MINMKRYAGGKTPYELFSEAVDRKNKNSPDTIALKKTSIKLRSHSDIMNVPWIIGSWDY